MPPPPNDHPLPVVPLPRRCRRCYYVLENLTAAGRCPECGDPFDLQDPRTFTTKPPFVWWTFWLPGFVTALLVGLASYAVMIPWMGYGWATVVGIPTMMGVVLGYRVRIGRAAVIGLAVMAATGAAGGLFTLNVVGVFCGIVFGLVAFVPCIVGSLVGAYLRDRLKQSNFSQRWHLPILILAPALLAIVEGRHTNMAVMTTSTSTVIRGSPDEVWKAIQFYEEVKHRPPWLLRLTPSFRPMYTVGKSEKVGDIKTCVYERGRLVKQVTEVVPGKRLAFRVIEQTDIENNSVRLIDGSFEFTPTPDGKGTIVKLTTRYEPLLAPRFAWTPAESLAVHTLHGHVLLGMKMDAEGSPTQPTSPRDAK